MTYLQLVNNVLARLRETEVSTMTNAAKLPTLVGRWVNQAKREVEDAFSWNALFTQDDITTVSGTSTYTLSGFGDRYAIQFVLDSTNNNELTATTKFAIERERAFTSDSNGVPRWWVISGVTSGDPQIELYPTPNGAYTVSVFASVSQADLSADSDVISVPSWPVVLQAYALAVSERGEDGGETFNEAQSRARSALQDAVSMENTNRALGHQSDWWVAYGPRA